MDNSNNDIGDKISKDFEMLRSISSDLIHENAELKNRLDVKERELDMLYTVIGRINAVLDRDEIQEIILELITDFFPMVRFCLMALFEEETGVVLRYVGQGGGQTAIERLPMPFEVDESTKWDEVVSTEEWNAFFDRHTGVKELQSSFIPLDLKARQLGFIMLSKLKDVEYGEDEWRLLRTISNYCAVSLDNSKLYELAISDTLTGLFNRRYFYSRLERELDRARWRDTSMALLMLDLDHFKHVNDDHGHLAGDQVLKEVANRMLNPKDDGRLVCRVGGEEFAIIFPNCDKQQAFERAEKIREAVGSKPFVFTSDDKEVTRTITISIGVSVFPHDSQELEAIINKADQALYLAKAMGRNRVVSHQ